MILNLYFLQLIFLFLLNNNILSKETIIFAFQMNRHGARAPYLGVKNGIDVYKEEWKQIEELSNVGRRQLYLLGTKVRKRYIDEYKLLSEIYNPQEIYIKSTDSNRTIESIYSFLQGLYPSGTGPLINEKVINNKTIIYPPNKKYFENFDNITNIYNMTNFALPFKMSIEPIHLFYKKNHELELYDTRYCLGHKERYEQLQRREEILNLADNIMNDTNKMFMELEQTLNETFLYDYWTFYKYMDGFLCDDTDIRKFDYIRKTYNENIVGILRNYSKQFLDMDYFGTNFPESQREIGIVASSFTFHSIIHWMEKAIYAYKNKKNHYLKYTIFSAHDSTIGSLESFMRLAFGKEMDDCTFADSRYFELYIDEKDDEYKVRYLKGDSTIKLNVNYEEFKNIVNNITWSDEKVTEFCQIEDKSKKKENNKNNGKKLDILGISIMISLITFNAILILFLIVFYIKKNKNEKI